MTARMGEDDGGRDPRGGGEKPAKENGRAEGTDGLANQEPWNVAGANPGEGV